MHGTLIYIFPMFEISTIKHFETEKKISLNCCRIVLTGKIHLKMTNLENLYVPTQWPQVH